jgi:hypothetical protein
VDVIKILTSLSCTYILNEIYIIFTVTIVIILVENQDILYYISKRSKQLLIIITGGEISMKKVLLALLVLSAFASQGLTFDEADLKKLKTTKSCPKCDLSNADLKGAKLKGADLSGADLSNINMGEADLRGAEGLLKNYYPSMMILFFIAYFTSPAVL